MSTISSISKRRVAQHVDTTLPALFDGPKVVKEVEGLTPVEALRLEGAGMLVRRGVVKTGMRGRPAIVWALSRKGRDRVRRAKAQA